jgi:hypothetical protein
LGKLIPFRQPRTTLKALPRFELGLGPDCGHRLDLHIVHPYGCYNVSSAAAAAASESYVNKRSQGHNQPLAEENSIALPRELWDEVAARASKTFYQVSFAWALAHPDG